MVNLKLPTAPGRVLCAIICLPLLALLVGCSSVATQKAFYEPITAELRAHNYDAVVAGIEKARADHKYKDKDRFVYFLDAGLAYHYDSQYDSSNNRLTQAENAADELFTKSISRAAASLILNDNILEYAGEDYEVLYTNLIMALNYAIMDEFDDALVEVKRANEKLELLEQKYRDAAAEYNAAAAADTSSPDITYEAKKVRFNNDAFARYLSMHMYAADGKYDDARIDHDLLVRAFEEQPLIYDFDIPKVKYSSPDGSILSVVALAGLSPVKEALNLRIRTDKELNLVQILYDDPQHENAEYGHIPMEVSEDYYFKFAIPQLVPRESHISAMRVTANGQVIGYLQLIEDVGNIADETFRAKKSLIYLRTVARAIVKGLAAHKQKQKLDDDKGGWLKKVLVDAITDFSENADLRCSRLLPGRIFVGDFVVDPGIYDITVDFLDSQGEVISFQTIEGYKVLESGLNLVEAVSMN